MILPNQSGFIVNCIHLKHSSRPIASFKTPLQSWDATFQGLCLGSCSSLMALSLHLLALLHYGLSISWLEISQKIRGWNLPVRHLSMLPTWKQWVKPLILLLYKVDFCWITAFWFICSLCSRKYWQRTWLDVHESLQLRNVPCSIVNSPWQWISGSLHTWNSN